MSGSVGDLMAGTSPIKTDERGRPYIDYNGKRSYISPVAMGGSAPKDTTSILRHAPQWNQTKGEWETPIDWGNITSLVTAGLLTAGAANMLMAPAAAESAATGASTAASTAGTGATLVGMNGAPIVAVGAAPTVAGAAGTAAAVAPHVVAPVVASGGFSLGKALTSLGPTGINAAANLYGQHAQISANDRAAQIQADATTHAADVQKQANDAALAFQREQATHQSAVDETTRHANYDQWAAGQHRLQSVGDLLGAGPREIPGYVPLPPANYGGAPSSGSVGALLNTGGNRGVTGQGQPTAGMVIMQAPDGSQQAVSPDQVAHFQQRGARVVGGG